MPPEKASRFPASLCRAPIVRICAYVQATALFNLYGTDLIHPHAHNELEGVLADSKACPWFESHRLGDAPTMIGKPHYCVCPAASI